MRKLKGEELYQILEYTSTIDNSDSGKINFTNVNFRKLSKFAITQSNITEISANGIII